VQSAGPARGAAQSQQGFASLTRRGSQARGLKVSLCASSRLLLGAPNGRLCVEPSACPSMSLISSRLVSSRLIPSLPPSLWSAHPARPAAWRADAERKPRERPSERASARHKDGRLSVLALGLETAPKPWELSRVMRCDMCSIGLASVSLPERSSRFHKVASEIYFVFMLAAPIGPLSQAGRQPAS